MWCWRSRTWVRSCRETLCGPWCWPNALQKTICIVFILTRQLLLFNESCELEPVVSLLLCVIQSVVLSGGSVRTVTLGSVLGVLLLLMIIMAVCVYKPLSRRWSCPGRRSRQRPRREDGPDDQHPRALQRGAAPAPRSPDPVRPPPPDGGPQGDQSSSAPNRLNTVCANIYELLSVF